MPRTDSYDWNLDTQHATDLWHPMPKRHLMQENVVVLVTWTAFSRFLGIYLYNGHPIRRVDIMGTVISVREKDAFYSYGGKSSHLRNCVCTDSPHSAERWSFSGPHVFEQLGPHQTERSVRVPCLEEVNEATGKSDTGDAVRCPLLGREEVEEWKCCGVGSPMVREDTQHPWHRCAGPRTGRAYRDPFEKRPSKCKNWPV